MEHSSKNSDHCAMLGLGSKVLQILQFEGKDTLFVYHLRLIGIKFSMVLVFKLSITVSLRSWSVYFIEYYLI